MKSLNHTLDKFFQRIPGSYWGIAGGIFGLLVFLIASLLYSLTEPYSIIDNAVSQLGWGPNGSEPVFRIGMIVLGCVLIPYGIFLTRFLWAKPASRGAKWRNILNVFSIAFAFISFVGLFMVFLFGNAVRDDLFYLHLIGAFIYFSFAILFTLFFTISMYLANTLSKIQEIFTIVTVSLGIACIISTIPLATEYGPGALFILFKDKTSAERVASLATLEGLIPAFPLTEWLFVIFTCVWFVVTATHTLKLQQK
ncbi:MAG: hypothetical protein RBG13Loki_2690 [Promethearchaeota archaeon CR_4]|nr:MAG: hypothetical protein RBG13Loki_2690 [Candidatus Lokiarchaeota archaeon CR_4]